MALAVETAVEGKIFFWGAPTFDQVRIGWNETVRAAGGIFDFTQQRMMAEYLPTGGLIIFRSLDDPDNARGHTADRGAFDEIADIKERAYYEVFRPMLIDTGGEFWGVGTPMGRNWFWREHKAALDRDDSACWQIPTVGVEITEDMQLVRKPHPYENPDIPFEEIVNTFNSTPYDIFRQEYLAEFIEGEGAVFRNIAACMGAKPSDILSHNRHRIVVGVDWGKQADYTAVSVGCADCRVEVAKDRFNKIDYIFQSKRLQALLDKWNWPTVNAERNSMIMVIEQLARDGVRLMAGADGQLGFNTSSTTKPQLIENLALIFEREEWQFIEDPVWTGELEAYERKVSPTTGRSQYSAPEGLHDDTVIGRALMVWAAGRAHSLPEAQPVKRSLWMDEDDDSGGSRWKRY